MARQQADKPAWKVHPILGWALELLVGVLAFLTVGVAILFPIAYSGAHGGFSSDVVASVVLLASFAAVAGTCLWLAYRLKRAVTREGSTNSFAERAAGPIVAGVALLFGLAFFQLTDPAPQQVVDVLPASD